MKQKLKSLLKKTPVFPLLQKFYGKLSGVPRHPIQDSQVAEGYNIIKLGSDYGGWSFVDEDQLKDCTIISAGLGEDASFDVEFAAKYNARVVIVDPTPRAIKHFMEIQNSLGSVATQKYSDGGSQTINSYDLSSVGKHSLELVAKALWNENKTLNFYESVNPQHVSHSIVNYQNNYSNDTSSIKVEAVTLDSLFNSLKLKVSDVPLMKFDIEGAEIEVLTRCLEIGILPRQILVEFDELNVPNAKGFARVTDVDILLKSNGYKLLKTDGKTDFLYYKC